MTELTIRLLDGEHVLRPPTYYGMQLMDEYGQGATTELAALPASLAALLTDAEPLDSRGEPARVWHPVEVSKLIPMDGRDNMWDVISALVEEALPQTKADTERPTKRRGSEKPSEQPAP